MEVVPESSTLRVNLCYGLRTLTLEELDVAQLDESVGGDAQRFTETVLAQFPTGGGEESDTGTEAQVEVCSAFALPFLRKNRDIRNRY